MSAAAAAVTAMKALVSRVKSHASMATPVAAAAAIRARPVSRTSAIAPAAHSAISESLTDSGISEPVRPTRTGSSTNAAPTHAATTRTQRRRIAWTVLAVKISQDQNDSSAWNPMIWSESLCAAR